MSNPQTKPKPVSTLFINLSIREQILFARNLALMAQANVPQLDSLKMLQKQAQSRSMRKILESVIRDVESGLFLSAALERFKSVFGTLFIDILRVGEASGTLSDNLSFLAEELKKKQLLKGKILSAMLYPIIIVITTAVLTAVLLFGIFPKIMPIFDSFKIQLPFATRALIGINRFAMANWAIMLVVLIAVPLLFITLLKVPAIRYLIHRFVLMLPIIGPMVRSIQMAILARTLAVLLKSGVKIVEAIDTASNIMPNMVYQKALKEVSAKVKSGTSLGEQLALYPKFFPLMFSQMINVSETAGTLTATLLYLSETYEEDVDESTRNLVSLLEPLLMVVMGGIVSFIALAILLPLFSLSQSIGQ